MQYDTAIAINAPIEAVWAVVQRPDQFAEWASGVIAVSGADGGAAVGQKIKIESSANPGRAFPVRVVEVEAPRRMVFRGGMPLGLFTGTRTYDLVQAEGGTTRFSMREVYAGPLAPLITRSIPDLQPSFDAFSAGLKATVEGAIAPEE